jgi:hypothetical protein
MKAPSVAWPHGQTLSGLSRSPAEVLNAGAVREVMPTSTNTTEQEDPAPRMRSRVLTRCFVVVLCTRPQPQKPNRLLRPGLFVVA